MKKKMIKPLLTIVCLLCSISASAYDFEVDGLQYDVVSLSDLTCKLVGTSNKDGFEGDVVIPANVNYSNKTLTVVEIESGLFRGCSNMTGVTIPNTISSVGRFMFLGCEHLENIKLADGETVLELGDRPFYDCPLKSLYIGRNLSYSTKKDDGYSPFYEKMQLKDVTIGNYVTWLGDYMFMGCLGLENVHVCDIEVLFKLKFSDNSANPFFYAHNLYVNDEMITELIIPNTVTEIADDLLNGCSSLTSVIIPNSVTSIGKFAFANCSGLTNLTIGNSVTSIGYGAFCYCRGLTSVTIPNSVTSIGNSAFEHCSGLTSLTIGNSATSIGNSATSIGNSAFEHCSGLTSLTIGNSVTSIGNGAFRHCSGLTSVAIPNSVTSIGNGAFNGCCGLTSLTIGNSVIKIEDYAFSGTALTSLYSLNTAPPEIGGANFTNNQYMALNVYVPEEALEAYQNAEGWKDFWNLQGFDPTGIKDVEVDGVKGDGKYYDLRGNKLDAPKRGINIINGKKVVAK